MPIVSMCKVPELFQNKPLIQRMPENLTHARWSSVQQPCELYHACQGHSVR